MGKQIFLVAVLISLAACATLPPRNIHNICNIFSEKDNWFTAANQASVKWNVPITALMAFIYQESKFDAYALPPEKSYFLGIIPRGRVSSAYGYSQAVDGTWEQYKEETGNFGADRDDFEDSVDFVGWYINKSSRLTGISPLNTYHQYLSYHEGFYGYNRRTYRKKRWLKKVARRVASMDKSYRRQFNRCKDRLYDDL